MFNSSTNVGDPRDIRSRVSQAIKIKYSLTGDRVCVAKKTTDVLKTNYSVAIGHWINRYE
jgi:hypothetical protein